MPDKVEKGMIVSKRRVLEIGGSKAVTLPKKWVDIQKWLGKEVTELVSLANECVVLVPPGQEEKAKQILREFENQRKTEQGDKEEP